MFEKFPKDVKIVFKNFPIARHAFAEAAAVAALAADRQGKFWQYHDLLFANYSRINDQAIDEFARTAGLDLERFAADKKDPALAEQVRRDQQDGIQAGVRGTPTIFINGRRMQNRSLDDFTAMIEEELRLIPDTKK